MPEATHHQPAPPPRFFWQAILILLPVALMAGFGFWAILRERDGVEAQAQQRAGEILAALPDDFGRMAAGQLTGYEIAQTGWHGYLNGAVSAWPESKIRQQWLADTNAAEILAHQRAALRSVFPDWPAGPVALAGFYLNAGGDPPFASQTPPQPPAWLTGMSTEQRQAWTALESAVYAAEPLSNLVAAVQQTRPPVPALVCAEFWSLRAASKSWPATNAIRQLLRFAGRHDAAISESGVPLATLALAEALNRAKDGGPTARLWEALQAEVASPNTLTPLVLDEASQLVANNPQLTESVQAMRILLADKMAQTELAEAINQTGKLHGITTTNLWLNALGRRWFCVLDPSAIQHHTTVSNRPASTLTPMTQVRCFSQSLVARAFADALTQAHFSLPPFFGLTLKLEGEPIVLPSGGTPSDVGPGAGGLLAERRCQMTQEAGMTWRAGDHGIQALLLARPGSRLDGDNLFFDDLPSHPAFTMQIRLTNRRLLYARQRQLQLIFGALIAASALAALIGVAAAYRAFRREQQLGGLKSNFVSSVSHELRAPIASIRLMAENLERGKIPDPRRQGEYFRFIVQECRRLSALVENVLDFSRIEQGRKEYEFEPTDLVALVQTTVTLMEPYASEKGVPLQLEAGGGEPAASGFELAVDGRALQQALVNLIDNAIKHSPKGEPVTVKLARQPRAVTLEVADRGPGIPRAEQERIFERFYRRGSELRRETRGIGIGLSIVKHIVEAHGGRVRVQSAPGQGSRFALELPTAPAHE